jgi:serine/threonine-protein kinase
MAVEPDSRGGLEEASTAQRRVGDDSRSGSSFQLLVQAMRSEERGRLRVTAQVLLGMACLGLILAPVMGGDPVAKKVFVGGLTVAVLTMSLLLRSSYVAEYNADLIGLGCVSLVLTYWCTLYFIGSASQAAMTGSLGLYIFCLGSSTRWAIVVYAATAIPHASLALAIAYGLVEDRGLVRVGGLPVNDQLALHSCVQAVYAIALLAGRRSRTKLESAFGELEAAARSIAQRDALLNEAKRALERVVHARGEGRFTEQVVGSFRLGTVIGRGSMGEVYEAVHVENDQPAAVKVLHGNMASDADSVSRLAREAKAAASFDSPHVVRVLEVSEEGASVPYLAMERLRGEDLASILRREQRLSTDELVELAYQVGSGLDAARNVGVIHRDIKPQNLFLARRVDALHQWKILDFGVSKVIGHATLTQNQLVGTPEYMAPEQASGEPLDHRADLYSLAAVIYRCVASRAPFMESSLAVLLQKVINRMPTRPGSAARVPAEVEAFLAIGLAKAPADRFESGAELAANFQLALEGRLPAALQARAKAILELTPWSN